MLCVYGGAKNCEMSRGISMLSAHNSIFFAMKGQIAIVVDSYRMPEDGYTTNARTLYQERPNYSNKL